DWPGPVLRFQMLMTHYRQPIDWTTRSTEQAASALDGIRSLTVGVDTRHGQIEPAVLEALQDDLNTPQALAELHKLAGEARKGMHQAAAKLRATCEFLGIDSTAVDLQQILKRQRGDVNEARIVELIEARNAARKAKNFAEADRIRNELAAMGVVLED